MPGPDRAEPTTCVLMGAGGHAASVLDVLVRAGWTAVLSSDASPSASWSLPVVDSDDAAIAAAETGGHVVVVTIGDNALRHRIAAGLPAGLLAAPLIAPSATVAADAEVGAGTVVLNHAHVGPRATIGIAAVINTAAIIEHDCQIGPGAHVAPGSVVLGGASIGRDTLVGSGARVLPGVQVGARVVIGAGAVVHRDVADGLTVVGVPARGFEE